LFACQLLFEKGFESLYRRNKRTSKRQTGRCVSCCAWVAANYYLDAIMHEKTRQACNYAHLLWMFCLSPPLRDITFHHEFDWPRMQREKCFCCCRWSLVNAFDGRLCMRPKRTPGLAALASFNHQKIMYTVKQEKKKKVMELLASVKVPRMIFVSFAWLSAWIC